MGAQGEGIRNQRQKAGINIRKLKKKAEKEVWARVSELGVKRTGTRSYEGQKQESGTRILFVIFIQETP